MRSLGHVAIQNKLASGWHPPPPQKQTRSAGEKTFLGKILVAMINDPDAYIMICDGQKHEHTFMYFCDAHV